MRFKYKYKAFISYKHSELSRQQAISLETALKRYAKPFLKPPIKIFRDEKQMVADNDLNKLIKDGLKYSEYLLYIAEAPAAESPWVQDEIKYWCETLKRLDKLIIIHVNDVIAFDLDKKVLDWEKTNALPQLLKNHLKSIPLYIDLTWAKRETQRDLNNIQYKSIVNNLTARFRKITPEQINDEEIKTFRKNKILVNITIGVIIILAIISLAFGLYAQKQKLESEKTKSQLELYVRHLDEITSDLEDKNQIIEEQLKTLQALKDEKERRKLQIDSLELKKEQAIVNARNNKDRLKVSNDYNSQLKTLINKKDEIEKLEDEYTKSMQKELFALDWIETDIKTQEILLINGFARAKRNGKWGYVDKDGLVVIECKFDKAERFNEHGFAMIKNDIYWAIINNKGELVTDYYDQIYKFSKNVVARVKKGKFYGFINNKGKVVVPVIYNYAIDFSDGFGKIRKKHKNKYYYAFVNEKGKQISKWYDKIYNFSDGLAKVTKNKRFGFINTKGKVVIPIKYSGADSFKNGKAIVNFNGFSYAIDTKGKKI